MDALLRRRAMIAAGGGSPTPPAPTFYDKLVFSGGAYIDTGITPPTSPSFLVMLGNETTKAQQRCFGVPSTNSGTIAMHYSSGTSSTNRVFNIYYGQSSVVSSNKSLAFSTTTYNFFLTPKRFGWGNTANSITRGSGNPSGNLVLGSNTSHSGTAYTGSMGEMKIYGSDAQDVTSASGFENYTPVYTLRPCTYNGEAGMWCVETSTFYGNTAGVGTLTAHNNS